MNLKNFLEESDLGFVSVSGATFLFAGVICAYALSRLRKVQRVSMWGEEGRGGMRGRWGDVGDMGIPVLGPGPGPVSVMVRAWDRDRVRLGSAAAAATGPGIGMGTATEESVSSSPVPPTPPPMGDVPGGNTAATVVTPVNGGAIIAAINGSETPAQAKPNEKK